MILPRPVTPTAADLEALYMIRQEMPDSATFNAFVTEHTALKPSEARRMVLAWDVARRSRELRELAHRRPHEVMNLVRGFIDAGANVEELRAFGDSERVVTEILSLPPRKRNARIRQLVGAKGSASAERTHSRSHADRVRPRDRRGVSAIIVNTVRRGFYLDSVALMRFSADLAALPGIEDAVAMIGTPANLEIMREAGLLAPAGEAAGPNDLVVAVRASDAAAAEAALDRAGGAFERKRAPAEDGQWRPRTLDGALDRMGDANLALVSTPGACAAREAWRALDRGLNVMLFSDNVPLESERALKERAHARGLIVMGPDCGTAYVAGTPLAFANVVPRGRVGVVAASGTGLQEVAVLLARAGAGVSHGIGVGGRDLSDAVGGIGALDAIDLLAADAGTDHLILVSKPPGPRTARTVFARLAAAGKPCTAVVFGAGEGEIEPPPAGPVFVPTLKAAVERAAGRPIAPDYDAGAVARDAAARLEPGRHVLRGLFCGGTLATEAHSVLTAAGLHVASNAAPSPRAGTDEPGSPEREDSRAPPMRHGADPPGIPGRGTDPASPARHGTSRHGIPPREGGQDLSARSDTAAPHTVIDLGADEYTLCRPHPMIDPAPRTAKLRAALADPEVAVVLLDVVLGLGAHADPARPVCDAVLEANGGGPAVVVSVCGTRDDPQDHEHQAAMLGDTGVIVAPSNADAAAVAAMILGHGRRARAGG